jgi:hypothetical protein
MPAALTVPYGNNASVGISKEVTYGTFVVPSIFHSTEDFDATPEQMLITRTGAKHHQGQQLPIISGFKGAFTFGPQSDADTISQILALALGAQTAPVHGIVNTTLTAATIIGATSFTLASTQNVRAGTTLTMGTDSLVVQSLGSGNTVTTTTAAIQAHASNAAVTVTATTAYTSTLSLGPVPSFSIESNRVTLATDYVGCAIDSLQVQFVKQKGMVVKATGGYASESTQASPTTPTFSTKSIPVFENPNNTAVIGGNALGIGFTTLHSFDAALKNNLELNYRPFGSRNVSAMPQKQRSVSGTFMAGFETAALYNQFIANAVTNQPVPIDVSICSSDVADATLGIPYSWEFVMNAVLKTHKAPIKSTDLIYQTFTYDCGETAVGGNDDMKIVLVNSASAIY